MKKKLVCIVLAILIVVSIMPISVFAEDTDFVDVKNGSYYYDSVKWAVENEITYGTSATTFSPYATCTRGQVVTFLWRANKCPQPKTDNNPFTDVKERDFFYDAVLWAVENEITYGTSATTFSPNSTCTQGQILTFLYRAQGEPSVITTANNAGQFYQKAVAWAETYGVLADNFNPVKACPRADVVTYLNYTSTKKPADVVQYSAIANEINDIKVQKNNDTKAFDSIDSILQHQPGEVNITQQEIDSIKQTHYLKSVVSQAEALADVDLYFRILKYGYGAYYYFGDSNFLDAKENIINEIQKRNTIKVSELGNLLYSNLMFVKDSHFNINGKSPTSDNRVKYKSYYTDAEFYKDDNGYYQMIYGNKWYYSSIENDNVFIALSLNNEGGLVYSPVQYCPIALAHSTDIITLECGDSKKEISIKWIENQPYRTYSPSYEYKLLEQDNIYYLSIRSFNPYKDESILLQYASDAAKMKNASAIIYDTRSNCGGSDSYCRAWVRNFSGKEPQINRAWADWENAIWNGLYRPDYYVALGSERYSTGTTTNANVIDNDIPIIFLTDSVSASSGESVLKYTRVLKNCIVIGSNTSGCSLCGNISYDGFSLPSSGIRFNFGRTLFFDYNTDEIEGKGYVPDIWCNPKTALGAVMKMLNNYDLADESTTKALLNKIG